MNKVEVIIAISALVLLGYCASVSAQNVSIQTNNIQHLSASTHPLTVQMDLPFRLTTYARTSTAAYDLSGMYVTWMLIDQRDGLVTYQELSTIIDATNGFFSITTTIKGLEQGSYLSKMDAYDSTTTQRVSTVALNNITLIDYCGSCGGTTIASGAVQVAVSAPVTVSNTTVLGDTTVDASIAEGAFAGASFVIQNWTTGMVGLAVAYTNVYAPPTTNEGIVTMYVNTNVSPTVGLFSSAGGTGLVTSTSTDTGKYLRGDGTWQSAAIDTLPPTNGSYVLQAAQGSWQWLPVAGLFGSNISAQISASPNGVTNIFSVAGTNDQTWTWTGAATTQILIKAWGAAGGTSSSTYGGNGGFVVGVLTVTNGMILTLRVPYGGGNSITQYLSPTTASWPGGGTYWTNATSGRGGGGGCAIILSGSNLLMVAAGGGGANNSCLTGGHGGWPIGGNGYGYSGIGVTYGGTQTAGGISPNPGGQNGSYLQGGSATNYVTQSGGGAGLYGGASGGNAGGYYPSGGGGSSYLSPLLDFGWGLVGNNTGDPDYITGTGAGGNTSVGGNGKIIIITPAP